MLWFALGRLNLLSNVTGEMKPGCRNLQISLIKANLSGIFRGGMQ